MFSTHDSKPSLSIQKIVQLNAYYGASMYKFILAWRVSISHVVYIIVLLAWEFVHFEAIDKSLPWLMFSEKRKKHEKFLRF